MSELEQQLTAIQQRADAATPGPWKADSEVRGDCVVWGPNGRFLMNQQAEPHWIEYPGEKRAVSYDVDRRDGEFIAAAREDVPALLTLVRELSLNLEAVRSDMRAAQAEAWESGRDAEFQRSVMKRQAEPNPYR